MTLPPPVSPLEWLILAVITVLIVGPRRRQWFAAESEQSSWRLRLRDYAWVGVVVVAAAIITLTLNILADRSWQPF